MNRRPAGKSTRPDIAAVVENGDRRIDTIIYLVHAARVHRKLIITVVLNGQGIKSARLEQFLTCVDIGDGQGAGCDLKRAIIFGDTAGVHTGDHGCIIGAGDGDGDVMGSAVDGGYRDSVGCSGTERQGLNGGIGIVERVGPVAQRHRWSGSHRCRHASGLPLHLR